MSQGERLTIVGVHGIGQHHRTKADLTAEWRRSLALGLGPEDAPDALVLAFYGHVFARAGTHLGDDGADWSAAEEAFVLGGLAEIAAGATAEPVADLGPPGVPGRLQRLLLGLDALFGRVASRTAVRLLRQVHAYLTDPGTADRIRSVVLAEVRPDTELLLAHSLGSVVAADLVLRGAVPPGPALLTIGSPLGLAAVRGPLLRALPPGAGTDPGRAWTNVADRRDVVTGGRGLAGIFARVTDVVVDNGWADPHAASRYLAHRTTGALVRPYLGAAG